MKRLALPLIAVGILAACGGGDETTVPAGGTPAPAAEPTVAPATSPSTAPSSPASAGATPDTAAPSAPVDVPEALGFAAPLVGGGDIELTTLAGRPVLLWFWAPW